MESEHAQFNIIDLDKPCGQSDSVLPWPEEGTVCVLISPCFGIPCSKLCSYRPRNIATLTTRWEILLKVQRVELPFPQGTSFLPLVFCLLLVLRACRAQPEPTPPVGLKIDASRGLGSWEPWEAGVSLLKIIATGSWLIYIDAWPGDTVSNRLPEAEPHVTARAGLPLTVTATPLSSLLTPKCHRKKEIKNQQKTPQQPLLHPRVAPGDFSSAFPCPISQTSCTPARAGNDCPLMKHPEYFA